MSDDLTTTPTGELASRIHGAIADAAYYANEDGHQVVYSQLHRADQQVAELVRRLGEATELLTDAWDQWAYPSDKPGALRGKWPGGLSTLEMIEGFLA